MAEITIKGLTFEPYISQEEIAKQVERVAAEIKRDCVTDSPIFVCVLKGAFVFASDLYRTINMPKSEIAFIRYKSYVGTESTGEMNKILGLNDNVTGREVIIIEDIVDTGTTYEYLWNLLHEKGVKDVKIATMTFKEDAYKKPYPVDFPGIVIQNKFVVGRGLDYNGLGRNLVHIYQVVK